MADGTETHGALVLKLMERLRTAEGRVATVEDTLRLFESSAAGVGLRAARASAGARAVEREAEREKLEVRKAAEPQRQVAFRRFAETCLEVCADGETAEFGLAWTYGRCCEREGFARDDDRRMDDSEFTAAVLALPGVEETVVRAGPLARPLPGYRGIEVQAGHRHQDDCRSRQERSSQEAMDEGLRAARRRELEARFRVYDIGTPTRPPPGYEPTPAATAAT